MTEASVLSEKKPPLVILVFFVCVEKVRRKFKKK